MKLTTTMWHRQASALAIAALALALAGCNGDDGDSDSGMNVAKAECGPNDRPETDLQGQVSAATRAAGFKGYSCNLQLIGQTKGDGGSWQHAFFQDKAGHQCGYYDTASFDSQPNPPRRRGRRRERTRTQPDGDGITSTPPRCSIRGNR